MFALLACPFAARALDLDLKLEPGAALSLKGNSRTASSSAAQPRSRDWWASKAG